jgi:hypothetical protein
MVDALFENIIGDNEDVKISNGNVQDNEHADYTAVLHQRAIRDTRKQSRDHDYALASQIREVRRYLIKLLAVYSAALNAIAVFYKRTTGSDNADSADVVSSEELKLKIFWRNYI